MTRTRNAVIDIPAWAVPYIVNNDSRGLSEQQIYSIEKWAETTDVTYINPPSPWAEKVWVEDPIIGMDGCMCVPCLVEFRVKTEILPDAVNY